MRLSDAKEQVYGPTIADRRTWAACSGTAVDSARDLGVFHRRRRARPTLPTIADRPAVGGSPPRHAGERQGAKRAIAVARFTEKPSVVVERNGSLTARFSS